MLNKVVEPTLLEEHDAVDVPTRHDGLQQCDSMSVLEQPADLATAGAARVVAIEQRVDIYANEMQQSTAAISKDNQHLRITRRAYEVQAVKLTWNLVSSSVSSQSLCVETHSLYHRLTLPDALRLPVTIAVVVTVAMISETYPVEISNGNLRSETSAPLSMPRW
eukprot:4548094-Amphidinium_carterae.1